MNEFEKPKDEKPQNLKNAIKDLFTYYKKFLPLFFIALFFGIGGAAFSLIYPYKTSELMDTISAGLTDVMDLDKIVSLCVFMVAIHICSLILSYIQERIMVTITQKMSHGLRQEINKKTNKITLKYFDSNNFGDLISRLVNDVDSVSSGLSQNLSQLVTAIIMLLGSAFMMLIINFKLAIATIAIAMIGGLVTTILIKKSQKYFNENRKNLGDLNGFVEETYAGHQIVKSYNTEEFVRNEFEVINERLYKSTWISNTLSSLTMPLMGFIGNLSFVIICVFGAYLVSQGLITFGIIVSFVLFTNLFIQPLSSISEIISSLQSTLAAAERVFEFLNQDELCPDNDDLQILKDVKGNVTFENVQFGYTDELVIKNFNASIKAGQKIAIVGHTGAGKTTLVNLLMRFYEVQDGDIKIDGISIKDISRANLHDLFGMVLQDSWIFHGTLRENLVYIAENVTDEEISAICKAIGLSDWIETLEDGYDTLLTESTTLSSGQQQLITIARAMIKNAPLLILDEATSSIDTRTEKTVQAAMDKLMENRTAFIIAHRLSTIKNADLILVINDGNIVEAGNHETLLAQNGDYATLYNSQFE